MEGEDKMRVASGMASKAYDYIVGVLTRETHSLTMAGEAVDPIVAKMEVFDPGVPFICATFGVWLLGSIGLVFCTWISRLSMVSAPLGEGNVEILLLLQYLGNHQFDTFGIVEGVHVSRFTICAICFHLGCAPPHFQFR